MSAVPSSYFTNPTPVPTPSPIGPSSPGFQPGSANTQPADLLNYNQALTNYRGFTPSQGYTPPQGQVLGAQTGPSGGGGGGGGNSNPHINPATGRWDDNYFASQGGSAPDISGQVNSAYNDAYSALDQYQQQLQSGRQNFLNTFTDPYNALIPNVNNAYTQGMNLNANQVQNTNQTAANAIAAARALFNEVNQGAQQRFGGSTGVGTGVSSAADFANAFYNRALGQNQTQIQNTQAQNLGGLQTQAANITSQRDTQLAQIDSQKTAALNQAQKVFQDELDQINSQRVQLGVDKAQQKLQSLQNYQNNINSINAQANQLASNLALQNNAARLGIQNSVGAYGNFANTPYATQGYGSPQYALPGQAGSQGGGFPLIGSTRNPQDNQNGFTYPQYPQVNLG